MSQPTETFSCPNCGQQFTWAPQLADRKLACACGAVLTIPPAIAPEPLPMMGDAEPPPGQLALDAHGREIVHTSQPRVLNYQAPRTADGSAPEVVRAEQLHTARERWVPMALLIGSSIIIGVVLAISRIGGGLGSIPATGLLAVLCWDIAVTYLVAPLISLVIDANTESLAVAAFKLLSATLARFVISAVFIAAFEEGAGASLGFVPSSIVFAVLLAYLFDLDLGDAAIAFLGFTTLRWLSYFGLYAIM